MWPLTKIFRVQERFLVFKYFGYKCDCKSSLMDPRFDINFMVGFPKLVKHMNSAVQESSIDVNNFM
jgi:hypothetical protein